MTLYRLLKVLAKRHRNMDYERSKTPWSIGLAGVRERLPDSCRCETIEEFETLIRELFASDYASSNFGKQADRVIGSSSDSAEDHAAREKYRWPTEYAGELGEYKGDTSAAERIGLANLLADEMTLASKDGSAYCILADIYSDFPEFVDKAFPVEVE